MQIQNKCQTLNRAILLTTFAVGVLGSVLVQSRALAETVKDKQLGFTLELSDEFTPRPDLVGATPDIVHVFQYGEFNEGEVPILLFIEKIGGTIGKERLKVEDFPEGFKGNLFVTKWQGFDVDGIEVPAEANGLDTITYNVQIPLKREAIQVKLLTPAGRAEEYKPLLKTILDGLEGETNWKSTSDMQSTPQKEQSGSVLGFFAVGIVVVLVLLIVLWIVFQQRS